MDASLVDAVHAVFHEGITLRSRLETGAVFHLEEDRHRLKHLLSALVPPTEKESTDGLVLEFTDGDSPAERSRLSRATIRQSLVCWLDEWLTCYSTASISWRANPLAIEYFGAAAGSTNFWDEARYAETRGDVDALEVMYLCVMLGFRGEWRDKPKEVDAWIARVAKILDRARPQFTIPPGLELARSDASPGPAAFSQGLAFSLVLATVFAAPLLMILWWRLAI